MIRKITYLKLLFFLFTASMAGQSNATPAWEDLTTSMGKEGIYLHYTHNVLFTGESLQYKVYTLTGENEGFAQSSKMAYVELLDQKGQRKIIQKVKLVNGVGHGDFFLPTDLESGYYTLTTYTRFMMNWPAETFFHDQVIIINPYTNNQRVFRKREQENIAAMPSERDQNIAKRDKEKDPTESQLKLRLNKDQFKTREKIQLSIQTTEQFFGEYSISVRRLPELITYKGRRTPFEYQHQFKNTAPLVPEKVKYLPELRGELITGMLHSSANDQAPAFKKVLFSIPGKAYELAMAQTDADGKFTFSLDTDNAGSTTFFQVLGENPQNYRIDILSNPVPDIEAIHENGFVLDPGMENEIKKRSISNQIENAYFEIKPDTVAISNDFTPFYGSASTTYNLDEYTRFPTFRETLIEIISDAWIDRDNDGNESVFVRDFAYTNSNFGYKPLVIVDGIVLQNHEALISYSARKIKSVRLVRNQIHIGGQIFQGIFDVQTFEDDFAATFAGSSVLPVELLRPIPPKKYFNQVYKEEERFSEIPDFRHQLLWNPDLNLHAPQTTLEFYASDVKGKFEIVIEGFTGDQVPVRASGIFNVE